jgi:hypothetical protein
LPRIGREVRSFIHAAECQYLQSHCESPEDLDLPGLLSIDQTL